ncbi:hypothetical protein V5799_007304 [Amblyomma americanum]|uniref:Uncharacterized protein n=1 Tax=Amblyomma americanum TaxID=6943 RepID=A0AAQ4DTX6_AMBAM
MFCLPVFAAPASGQACCTESTVLKGNPSVFSNAKTSPRAMHSTVLLVVAMLLLPRTDANTASSDSVLAPFGLYSIRGSSICAALENTSARFFKAVSNATPDSGLLFENAQQLPLSKCGRPQDIIFVDEGRYKLLWNAIDGTRFHERNYTVTLCVNANHASFNLSCYRLRDQNGETYFVAPTDYKQVFFRGPVSFHSCPQAFEVLGDASLSLIENETACATFLTVSSYGVRTDSGDCVHLYRYALFKDYPEVWNGCQRYAEADSENAFYDCKFVPHTEPWNYPTQDEVSYCADRVRPVECSSVKFDSEADTRYFYAGRGKGEMTQNKFDRERCLQPSTDDYGSSSPSGESAGSYFNPYVLAGGIVICVTVIGIAIGVIYLVDRGSLSSCEPASPATGRRVRVPHTVAPGPPPTRR